MKTLTKILFILPILFFAGCGNSPYNFNGKIGNEIVTFENSLPTAFSNKAYNLYVKKMNSTNSKVVLKDIIYMDYDGDLKLDAVKANGIFYDKEKGLISKTPDPVGTPVVEEAQKQFDNYLNLILKTKIEQGLRSLKEQR